MKIKLGRDLVEGDVIEFWTFDAAGARIAKLWSYTGRYPEIVCAIARLEGRAAMRGDEQSSRETAIESDMAYTCLG